jgi:SAM-dependent methyltransferase
MEHDDARIIRRFFRSATPKCLKSRLLPFEAALKSQAAQFCSRYPYRLILDLGCGRECYGSNTIGVDLRLSNLRGCHTHLVSADAMRLPFASGCFDAALCSAALHHFENPEQALTEMHRALREGGELLLTIPDQFPKTKEPDDHWRFDRLSMVAILERTGWKVAMCSPIGGRFWILSRYSLEWLFQWDRGVRLVIFMLAAPVLGFLLPLACFYLDQLVTHNGQTLGWAIVARKDGGADVVAGFSPRSGQLPCSILRA